MLQTWLRVDARSDYVGLPRAQYDALMEVARLVKLIGTEDAERARAILRAAGIDPNKA
jgi:hypothetical protein